MAFPRRDTSIALSGRWGHFFFPRRLRLGSPILDSFTPPWFSIPRQATELRRARFCRDAGTTFWRTESWNIVYPFRRRRSVRCFETRPAKFSLLARRVEIFLFPPGKARREERDMAFSTRLCAGSFIYGFHVAYLFDIARLVVSPFFSSHLRSVRPWWRPFPGAGKSLDKKDSSHSPGAALPPLDLRSFSIRAPSNRVEEVTSVHSSCDCCLGYCIWAFSVFSTSDCMRFFSRSIPGDALFRSSGTGGSTESLYPATVLL